MKEERESYHHSTTRPIRGELEVGPDISMTTGEEWCRHLVRCWKPGSVRRSDRATSSLTVRWTANPSDRCGHRTNRAEDHGEAWTDELDRDGRTTRVGDTAAVPSLPSSLSFSVAVWIALAAARWTTASRLVGCCASSPWISLEQVERRESRLYEMGAVLFFLFSSFAYIWYDVVQSSMMCRGRGESMGGMQSPRRKKLGVVDGGRAKATFAREIKVWEQLQRHAWRLAFGGESKVMWWIVLLSSFLLRFHFSPDQIDVATVLHQVLCSIWLPLGIWTPEPTRWWRKGSADATNDPDRHKAPVTTPSFPWHESITLLHCALVAVLLAV